MYAFYNFYDLCYIYKMCVDRYLTPPPPPSSSSLSSSSSSHRFEKRIYIALPEAEARTRMFNIHIGDTPNSLSPADFTMCGNKTEGFSGSDISVVVREALMEPLRKCQSAKQFYKHADGFYRHVTVTFTEFAGWFML